MLDWEVQKCYPIELVCNMHAMLATAISTKGNKGDEFRRPTGRVLSTFSISEISSNYSSLITEFNKLLFYQMKHMILNECNFIFRLNMLYQHISLEIFYSRCEFKELTKLSYNEWKDVLLLQDMFILY